MARLAEAGVETRPFFYPMHTLPMYQGLALGQAFPVAERIAAGGVNLPSSASLSEDDIDFVCEQLIQTLQRTGTPGEVMG